MTSQQFKCAICTKDIPCSVKSKVIANKIYCSNCIVSSNSNNKISLKPQNTAASSNNPYREEMDGKQPSYIVNESGIIKNGHAPTLVTDHPNSVEYVEPDVHSIIAEVDAENPTVDNIFHDLSKDMNIVVCGPPRAGKSTLINAICGREVPASSFVRVEHLQWLLRLCMEKHIFCALVCTYMYAGDLSSRKAVLDNYDRPLSRYITDSPREDNGVKFYGNIGLTIAVNSQPF
ncbi:unnamed protein product [Adineta ricciae]|uniref:G domain-containing protein n=1 Tax=Adineta ricciae TaxID=249248 RepID=A0A815TQN8_ADIRI|nr:unnamed protein product [Adineta ricciae]CAF1504042.1 unnamed protein product [Adineta ricciae]